MLPSTIVVLLFFLLSHPASTHRPADDRMNAIWKKLHAASKQDNNNEPTVRPMLDQPFGGILNTHVQSKPRTSDRMRDLIQARNQDSVTYAPPEASCNFEGSCGWKWKNEMAGGFRIGSTANGTGPTEDANGNKNGKFDFFYSFCLVEFCIILLI